MADTYYNPDKETFEQFNARRSAQGSIPGSAPVPEPAPDPNKALFEQAAKSGIGLKDIGTILPSQKNTERDKLAKNYGYDSFDAFTQSVFKPSTSTTKLYNDAYKAAGLDATKAKIEERRQQLNQASGAINDNPWLSEASRSGKYRDLQALAQGDINQFQQLYDSGLQSVNSLVDRSSTDLHNDQALRASQLNFLVSQAEETAQAQQQAQIAKYLPDYMAASPKEAPKTVSIGDSLYQWNGTDFEIVGSAPNKPVTLSDGQTLVDPVTGRVIAGNGGGANNPSAGIVGGYNIGSYATDPQHEQKVAAIYAKTQNIKTAAQADAYIKASFPNSPITGGMVFNAASQNGIDPGMLIAMMQQDSSLGTAGLGAKTFNPGNVGNDDAGNVRNYGSWPAGVNAVAQWLAKKKVAGSSAFTQAAQNVAAGLTADQRKSFNQNFAQALSTDPAQAKNLLITTAINALPSAELKNKAFGRIQSLQELDRLQGLLNEFKAAGGTTGLLTGTQEQIAQKLGKTSDPKLAQIGNGIMATVVAYRNAVSGAAFTESEAQMYDKMFPSAKKDFQLNSALISSLKDSFNGQQRAALSTVLGSTETYDQLQNAARAGQIVSVQGKAYRVAPDGDTLIPMFSTKK